MTVHSLAIGKSSHVEALDEMGDVIWIMTRCGERISGEDQFRRKHKVIQYAGDTPPDCQKCKERWETDRRIVMDMGRAALNAMMSDWSLLSQVNR